MLRLIQEQRDFANASSHSSSLQQSQIPTKHMNRLKNQFYKKNKKVHLGQSFQQDKSVKDQKNGKSRESSHEMADGSGRQGYWSYLNNGTNTLYHMTKQNTAYMSESKLIESGLIESGQIEQVIHEEASKATLSKDQSLPQHQMNGRTSTFNKSNEMIKSSSIHPSDSQIDQDEGYQQSTFDNGNAMQKVFMQGIGERDLNTIDPSKKQNSDSPLIVERMSKLHNDGQFNQSQQLILQASKMNFETDKLDKSYQQSYSQIKDKKEQEQEHRLRHC